MKMATIWFFIVCFVLVCEAKPNGGQVFSAPKSSVIPTIKGRLLTPQEGCGYSKVLTKRIVGGSAAKNAAYPWIAMLGFNRSVFDSNDYFIGFEQSFSCGGSLITSKHVLSAAHCIDEELVLVRLGEYNTSTTSDGAHQDVSVDHALKHKEFDGVHMINDIAIIHLAHDVDFTDRIRPVCLPINPPIVHRIFSGSNAFVAGWGSTSENRIETSKILMQLQVPVIEVSECEKEYRLAKSDPKRQNSKKTSNAKIVFDAHILCAGHLEGGKGTYFGDSGGPLMVPVFENGTFPFYQIGIVSGSEGCALPGMLDVYASVQYYADWIHENLKLKNSTES